MNHKSSKKQKGHAPSSNSAPAPRNRGEFNGQNSQNFKGRLAQFTGSVAQVGSWASLCGRYGRNHVVKCRDVQSGCFKCEQKGHFMKEYPNNQKGSGQKNKDGSLGICIDYR